jgi:Fic family protein
MEPRFQITHAMTSGLTRIERARGFLDAAKLSEDWLETMQSRALLLEAHHTTHIEGTRLTLDQAERLLAGELVPEADPDDARELLNYRQAFEFVSGYLGDGGPVTEGLIREIHRRLVEGVRGETGGPGEYRRVQNYVANLLTGTSDLYPTFADRGAAAHGGVGRVAQPTRRGPPRAGGRDRAVSVGSHSSVRGWKWKDFTAPFDAVPLSGGL